jgi:hypothetical protein
VFKNNFIFLKSMSFRSESMPLPNPEHSNIFLRNPQLRQYPGISYADNAIMKQVNNPYVQYPPDMDNYTLHEIDLNIFIEACKMYWVVERAKIRQNLMRSILYQYVNTPDPIVKSWHNFITVSMQRVEQTDLLNVGTYFQNAILNGEIHDLYVAIPVKPWDDHLWYCGLEPPPSSNIQPPPLRPVQSQPAPRLH